MQKRPDIRAAILTGSSVEEGRTDELSDLDIELFSTDSAAYVESDEWMSQIGKVWVYIPERTDDGYPTRLVIFQEGAKVDFTFYPVEVLVDRVHRQTLPAAYERGYRVLLDTDNLASQLPAPAGKWPASKPPTQEEFRALVNEFWFEAYHVAKYLSRKDLWAAKFRDWGLKELLLKMIEWHEKSLHGWDYDTRHLGVRMREWVEPQVWEKLRGVFSHFEAEDGWLALTVTVDLFRELTKRTAEKLGHHHPIEVDESVNRYIQSLRGGT